MKIAKQIILQKLGDEYAAYDYGESVMHSLNETAYLVVKKIEEGLIEEKIVEVIAKKYGVEIEKVRKDVGELVKELVKKKIVIV